MKAVFVRKPETFHDDPGDLFGLHIEWPLFVEPGVPCGVWLDVEAGKVWHETPGNEEREIVVEIQFGDSAQDSVVIADEMWNPQYGELFLYDLNRAPTPKSITSQEIEVRITVEIEGHQVTASRRIPVLSSTNSTFESQGTFIMRSPEMVVSDFCYAPDPTGSDNFIVYPVRTGRWQVLSEIFIDREIKAYHGIILRHETSGEPTKLVSFGGLNSDFDTCTLSCADRSIYPPPKKPGGTGEGLSKLLEGRHVGIHSIDIIDGGILVPWPWAHPSYEVLVSESDGLIDAIDVRFRFFQ